MNDRELLSSIVQNFPPVRKRGRWVYRNEHITTITEVILAPPTSEMALYEKLSFLIEYHLKIEGLGAPLLPSVTNYLAGRCKPEWLAYQVRCTPLTPTITEMLVNTGDASSIAVAAINQYVRANYVDKHTIALRDAIIALRDTDACIAYCSKIRDNDEMRAIVLKEGSAADLYNYSLYVGQRRDVTIALENTNNQHYCDLHNRFVAPRCAA